MNTPNLLLFHRNKYENLCVESSVLLLVDNHQYQEALQVLQSTRLDTSPDLLYCAASCYFALNQIHRSLEITCLAEERGWLLPKILILKSRCLCKIGEYEAAYATLQSAYGIQPSKEIQEFIIRVKSHFQKDLSKLPVFDISNIEHNASQDLANVYIQFYIQGIEENDISVEFDEKEIRILLTRETFSFIKIKLQKKIIPKDSSFILTKESINLSLKKEEETDWDILECVEV